MKILTIGLFFLYKEHWPYRIQATVGYHFYNARKAQHIPTKTSWNCHKYVFFDFLFNYLISFCAEGAYIPGQAKSNMSVCRRCRRRPFWWVRKQKNESTCCLRKWLKNIKKYVILKCHAPSNSQHHRAKRFFEGHFGVGPKWNSFSCTFTKVYCNIWDHYCANFARNVLHFRVCLRKYTVTWCYIFYCLKINRFSLPEWNDALELFSYEKIAKMHFCTCSWESLTRHDIIRRAAFGATRPAGVI